jgi:serine/threonine protein kinase
MIILEFAARGDLRQYLLDHRPARGHEALLTLFDLAQMALDIANGMVFLSSQSFVHRDLAARLVMMIMLLLLLLLPCQVTMNLARGFGYRCAATVLLQPMAQ